MEAYEGEHLSEILAYEFKHMPKNGGIYVITVSFSQAWVGFMDQRCSNTPQLVTTEWDITIPSFR